MDAQSEPRHRCGQAQGFVAIGVAVRPTAQIALERAVEGEVERIAHLGRTIRGEVVVAVLGVLLARVVAQEGIEHSYLLRREVQPLHGDATAVGGVAAQVVLQRDGEQAIRHAAAQEAQQEVLLLEIEVAVVVEQRIDAVVDQDRVVAETRPVLAAWRHRDQPHARRWRILRKCRADRQPQCEAAQGMCGVPGEATQEQRSKLRATRRHVR